MKLWTEPLIGNRETRFHARRGRDPIATKGPGLPEGTIAVLSWGYQAALTLLNAS